MTMMMMMNWKVSWLVVFLPVSGISSHHPQSCDLQITFLVVRKFK